MREGHADLYNQLYAAYARGEEIQEPAKIIGEAILLATEIQMTRRRVNVLGHVVIPELHETIRFIFDKLAEDERDNISRLMKIADIIRA